MLDFTMNICLISFDFKIQPIKVVKKPSRSPSIRKCNINCGNRKIRCGSH